MSNETSEGTLYYYAFKVSSAKLADGTTAFYTPSLNIALFDLSDKYEITKLPVTVPAVTDVKKGDYTFTEATTTTQA